VFSHLIYTVQPCLIHTCHAHAVLLNAMSQHVHRETACGPPACIWLYPVTTWSSTKVVIRSIPISDAGGQCESKQCLSLMRKRVVATQYQKDELLHCWTSSSDISGPRGVSQRTWHGQGMLCVNWPLVIHVSFTSFELCILIHICNKNQQNAH